MNEISRLELQTSEAPSSLRKRVKHYDAIALEVESYLKKNPNEWGRFQSQFNQEINAVYREIMMFEKECLASENEEKVFAFKKLFVNRLRKRFLRGEFVVRSLEKPFGYAGDFKIIDDIYKNYPTTKGFDRLYDNYFQMSSICVAVRNRKEDFKRILSNFVIQNDAKSIKVMDVASGPCRDIKELLFDSEGSLFDKVIFDCFDADHRALEYARQLVRNSPRVSFNQMNVLRIALKKNIHEEFKKQYDVIFSTGLFDYLDVRISIRLIHNLRELLKPGGILAISDVRDKFSNPSMYFMEWVADWSLIYREDDEFRQLFIRAGFSNDELATSYEQQGIMQYVLAKKLHE